LKKEESLEVYKALIAGYSQYHSKELVVAFSIVIILLWVLRLLYLCLFGC